MDTRYIPPALPESQDYGVEVLCASWNPVATVVVEAVGRDSRELIADLSAREVDAFLQQFYRCQKS